MYVTGSTKISFTDYDNFKPVLLIWPIFNTKPTQFGIQDDQLFISMDTKFCWLPIKIG